MVDHFAVVSLVRRWIGGIDVELGRTVARTSIIVLYEVGEKIPAPLAHPLTEYTSW